MGEARKYKCEIWCVDEVCHVLACQRQTTIKGVWCLARVAHLHFTTLPISATAEDVKFVQLTNGRERGGGQINFRTT